MLPDHYPRPLSLQRAPQANWPLEQETDKVTRHLWMIARALPVTGPFLPAMHHTHVTSNPERHAGRR